MEKFKRKIACATYVILSMFFLSAPQTSLAVEGEFLIPLWVTPSQSQVYSFSDQVILNGTWQLPPNWVGQISVYIDATVDVNGAFLNIGTPVSDINTGQFYYEINNATGIATSSGSWVYNLGALPDGAHNVHIRFFGGTECAVNKSLNNRFGTSYAPTCDITADNARFNLVWPVRSFTIGLPPFPRLVVSPTTSPALDYLNTALGDTARILSFNITNTGSQTLNGSIATDLGGPISAPFNCVLNCPNYTLNPGVTKEVRVRYYPTTAPSSVAQTWRFSCIGSTLGCDGAPFVTTYQMRNITGNSVPNALPPAISITPALINYGTVYTGLTYDRTITVRNIGGGILDGLVALPADYTCVSNCFYSLGAGASIVTTIRYTPIIPHPPESVTAVFSGGGDAALTLNSTVSDLPVAQANPTFLNFGMNINVGNCVDRTLQLRNVGAGTLSSLLTGIPIASSFTDELPDFSCVGNCGPYTLNNPPGSWTPAITLRFCPVDANPANGSVLFTNPLNALGEATVTLQGQGNILPIGGASSLFINFGNQLINTPSSIRSITISNNGVGNLIGSVGPMPAGFSCISATCAGYNIPSGISVQLDFRFTPTATIAYNDNVDLSGIGTLNLRGVGVEPKFAMSYTNWPDAAGCMNPIPAPSCLPPSPNNHDIGVTIFGGLLQNKDFDLYVQNIGNGASVNYSIPNTAHFVCMSGCAGTLAQYSDTAFNYRLIQMRFTPSVPGVYNEPLVIAYDYGDGVPRTATLNLNGESVAQPYLSISPNTVQSFGNVSAGSVSTPLSITVTNLGTYNLNGSVNFASLSGGGATTAGLTEHWTFDTTDINWSTHKVIDRAGGDNEAFFTGPVSATPRVGNAALSFNGIGGVSVPIMNGLPSGNVPHTMAGWIKVNQLPLSTNRAWIALLGSESTGSHLWRINSSGVAEFGVYNGVKFAPTLPVGTWVHVASVYDGSNLKGYVNGVQISTALTSFNFGAVKSLKLGLKSSPANEEDFNGVLDDVRVYDRALSGVEVNDLYVGIIPPSSGMIGHYTFDDPSVQWNLLRVQDASTQGNNGELSRVPTGVTGKIGEAFNFSGAGQEQVSTSQSKTSPAIFSVGAWFRTGSASGKKIVGFESRRYQPDSVSYDRHLYVGTDGRLHFGITAGSVRRYVSSVGSVTDGAWHHALATYGAGGVITLYLDGVLEGTLTAPTPSSYTGYWRMGGQRLSGWLNGSDGYVNGSIDDVRIYNRALSAVEVADLYGAGASGDAGVFSCISNCVFGPIAPNDSRVVQFTFSPTA